jgi:hypothetical protein
MAVCNGPEDSGMKRTPFNRRPRVAREADQLVWLADGLARSSSRVEDAFWESRLSAEVTALVDAEDEAALTAALDRLSQSGERGFEELADVVESRCESASVGEGDSQTSMLLLAIPILAWSRLRVPSGNLPDALLAALRGDLQAHVLDKGARVVLGDFLFSPDQLPQGYIATANLARRFFAALEARRPLRLDPADFAETGQFLSDIRYVLAAVAIEPGAALFRWHSEEAQRDALTASWAAAAHKTIATAFPACAFQVLTPDALFAACRESDRQLRPYSLDAGIEFLRATLGVEPPELRAFIGGFHGHRLEEYRIGLCLPDGEQVVHGLVWPLLDAEDENSEIAAEIEQRLRDAGVSSIHVFEQRFPLEFCDDCGAPLYPNEDGEPVHPEMPEQPSGPSAHLH